MTVRARLRAAGLRALLPLFLPLPVRRVMRRLQAAGARANLVGGCVRDVLLLRRPLDWDLATGALPPQVMALFPGAVPTGVEHGTVTVREGGQAVEVTTYRVEGPYTDRRHPDRVWFTSSLAEDLKRRDVTINALACDQWGRLCDPAGGLEDLVRRRLRAVGDPDARFSEDALRPLRVVRLAAQLGFSVDGPTWEAVRRAAPTVAGVSAERVREELSRALLSPRPRLALQLLRESGLLEFVLPELGGAQWERSLLALDLLPPRLELRLAALFLGRGGEGAGRGDGAGPEESGAALAGRAVERLRFDGRTAAAVESLVAWRGALSARPPSPPAGIRRVGARVGRALLEDLARLRAAEEAASRAEAAASRAVGGGPAPAGVARRFWARGALPGALVRGARRVARGRCALRVEELAIGGREVMEIAGLSPGPEVGRCLERLLEAVLADPRLNTRRRLASLVREAGPAGPRR